jgi:hypothetical protein
MPASPSQAYEYAASWKNFILLSFSNLVIIIVVNSPMNKLIAFCTHFSLICMLTGVGNIAIRSASIADFQ